MGCFDDKRIFEVGKFFKIGWYFGWDSVFVGKFGELVFELVVGIERIFFG